MADNPYSWGYRSLEATVGQLVMPGDEFLYSPVETLKKTVLGPGLRLLAPPTKPLCVGEEVRVVATRSGVLSKIKGDTYIVDLKVKQLDIYKKDDVVGIIKQKGKGDHYLCDLGTKERVQLSKFAFEGATKRFKPDLQVGDVVFGKVLDLPPDFPVEMTCVHSNGKALGLGALEGGDVVQVPIHFTRVLRSPSSNILQKIGKIVPCETAVGVNGFVWVRAKSAVLTATLGQFLVKLSQAPVEMHNDLITTFRKAVSTLV